MITISTQIKHFIKNWIKQHDRVATHYKIWSNAGSVHFQCCIRQEPYGHIFNLNSDNVVNIVN